jgi:hypothetical protein
LLLVTSTARTSNVSSSIPMCILRQIRRLGPPRFRAFHSPSPSALIPVLSIRRFSGPIRQVHLQHSLTATQRTEVGRRPIQTGQLQKTFDEPRRLPQGHAKQHLHGQASLDRRIAEFLLSTTLAGRRWPPCHPGIEPNRQRSTLLQRLIVSRPVCSLVLCGMPTAHDFQLSCWIHVVYRSPDLCNKAELRA